MVRRKIIIIFANNGNDSAMRRWFCVEDWTRKFIWAMISIRRHIYLSLLEVPKYTMNRWPPQKRSTGLIVRAPITLNRYHQCWLIEWNVIYLDWDASNTIHCNHKFEANRPRERHFPHRIWNSLMNSRRKSILERSVGVCSSDTDTASCWIAHRKLITVKIFAEFVCVCADAWHIRWTVEWTFSPRSTHSLSADMKEWSAAGTINIFDRNVVIIILLTMGGWPQFWVH